MHLVVCNLTSSLKRPAEQLFGQGVELSTTRDRLEQLYGLEDASFRLFELKPKGVCAEITLPLRIVPVESGSAATEVSRS